MRRRNSHVVAFRPHGQINRQSRHQPMIDRRAELMNRTHGRATCPLDHWREKLWANAEDHLQSPTRTLLVCRPMATHLHDGRAAIDKNRFKIRIPHGTSEIKSKYLPLTLAGFSLMICEYNGEMLSERLNDVVRIYPLSLYRGAHAYELHIRVCRVISKRPEMYDSRI